MINKVILVGKLTEICGKCIAKAKMIYIEGKIQTRALEDKEGNKRSRTEVVASDMTMLDSKGQSARGTNEAFPESPPYFSSDSLPDDDVSF